MARLVAWASATVTTDRPLVGSLRFCVTGFDGVASSRGNSAEVHLCAGNACTPRCKLREFATDACCNLTEVQADREQLAEVVVRDARDKRVGVASRVLTPPGVVDEWVNVSNTSSHDEGGSGRAGGAFADRRVAA